ncbi:MAG: hypothetical protein Q4A16_03140 [Lautropia sp.]|nr:hypothetical protein [Lautropia sp.]
MMSPRDDVGISRALIHAMEATSFLTPQFDLDGSTLAFIGPIAAGREAETFATLLTFTLFVEQPERVIDEAYSSACADTGAASRLNEDDWYRIARDYFEEMLEYLNTSPTPELQHRLAWLDEHFFARHDGYLDARVMIERFLASRDVPLH